MSKEHIVSFVKKIRISKELTQQELASSIGVSRQTVVAIEGSNYTPSVLLALKIALVLNVQVEDLFTKIK